jgi:hypothetical protein
MRRGRNSSLEGEQWNVVWKNERVKSMRIVMMELILQ